jgi:hypothetical protein
LYRLFIVDSATVGASALLVSVFETVKAELAYLIPARTRLEILVCEVELLDAKRAAGAIWSAEKRQRRASIRHTMILRRHLLYYPEVDS